MSNTTHNNVCILGSFNVDIVATLARFPKGGESLMALQSQTGAGGKGTNQAIAASNAEACVHFVTKVGQDHFSQFAKDTLSRSKLHSFTLYESKTQPTGTALIYVSKADAENMIAICSGANTDITQDEVTQLAPYLLNANVLLVQLENNFEATLAAIHLARTSNTLVVMNPAPYNSVILEHLSDIDIITPNETEATLLSGIEVIDIESAKLAAKVIHEKGVKTVIITLGSAGVLIYDHLHAQMIPAFKTTAIDTTGAGDAFNGAFVAALAKGQRITEAAQYGCAFASLAVERMGASNMPSHQEALTRLATL